MFYSAHIVISNQGKSLQFLDLKYLLILPVDYKFLTRIYKILDLKIGVQYLLNIIYKFTDGFISATEKQED